jgi:hypothetical protein
MMILEFHTYIVYIQQFFLTKKDISQALYDCCLLMMAPVMEGLGAIMLISC